MVWPAFATLLIPKHLCKPFKSWKTHSTHFDIWFHHFKWDWRASNALLSVLASYGTRRAHWAGGILVTLGDYRHLASLEFVGSLSGYWWLLQSLIVVIMRGSWPCPYGRSQKVLYWITHDVECPHLCWFLWRPSVELGVVPIIAWTTKWISHHNGD
jgi:hypothetical protein